MRRGRGLAEAAPATYLNGSHIFRSTPAAC